MDAGQIIDGKYVVEHVVGEGGMGVVIAARHLKLHEQVALKILRPEVASDPQVVARFMREARAAVRLKSEYVARVIDVGTMDGLPFMVMEYLEGHDLGHAIEERGRLDITEAVEYATQICEALAEAHANGIVHRDVKPENLFLTARSDGWKVIKVLDFGISKVALTGSVFDADEVSLIKTTHILGTPLYMSPEQIRAHDVDHRTDIWSLGVVLYELLAGQAPFFGDSITQQCAVVLETAPLPLKSLRDDVPTALEAIIHRCLEKDPAIRYSNVAELAIDLLPFAPKRARHAVERATSLMRAAGMLKREVLMPSSRAPTTAEALPLVAIPRAPATPAEAAALTKQSSPPSRRTRSRIGYVLVGIVVGAVGLASIGYRFMESQSAVALPFQPGHAAPEGPAAAQEPPAPPPAAQPDKPADSETARADTTAPPVETAAPTTTAASTPPTTRRAPPPAAAPPRSRTEPVAPRPDPKADASKADAKTARPATTDNKASTKGGIDLGF